ncbi:HAD family phosphatase [uncultured Cohaesibacter sp.]|uniref:HAD family hydrolase n=1 Tax=uncultured Cohaesibacter sp. TaxID=1002546 RepID=UPI0029C64197|nr:HAD family phosphatase [uncultured Cohaesibacter sp.]
MSLQSSKADIVSRDALPALAVFKASIFDLDGTLVHSEHVWEEAKLTVLSEYGFTPTRAVLDAHIGRGLGDFLEDVFGHPLSQEQKTEIGNKIGAKADVLLPQMRMPVEGSADLLKALHETGQRIAICSSSPRRHIVSAMAELGITDCIETIVSGSELPKGKPHPLPYLTALSALKLDPQDACAFEDSLPGAKSAHAAGLSVFAIGEGCTGPNFSFCTRAAESFPDFMSRPFC